MPKKRTYISVKQGTVQSIMKELNVHRSAVYSALNYSSNSESAQKIRQLALNVFGGVECSKVIW